MKVNRLIAATTAALLLLTSAAMPNLAAPQALTSLKATARGHGTLTVGKEVLKVHTIVVQLDEDGTGEITLVTDLQFFVNCTWSAPADLSKGVDLKITGGTTASGATGSGRLLLRPDGKSIAGLSMQGSSNTEKRKIQVDLSPSKSSALSIRYGGNMKPRLIMPRVILLVCAFVSIGLLSSMAHAQKTTAGFDKAANFANYKTFMFSNTNGARNPFVNDMIIKAVERELTARGLTKVDANPDLRIAYLAGTGMNVQVAAVPFGYAVNPAYSGLVPTATTAMWDVTTGTLVIDLYDNKADRVVFRGTAKEVLQHAPSADPMADAKMVSKTVNKGIAKIFKKYPVNAK